MSLMSHGKIFKDFRRIQKYTKNPKKPIECPKLQGIKRILKNPEKPLESYKMQGIIRIPKNPKNPIEIPRIRKKSQESHNNPKNP